MLNTAANPCPQTEADSNSESAAGEDKPVPPAVSQARAAAAFESGGMNAAAAPFLSGSSRGGDGASFPRYTDF